MNVSSVDFFDSYLFDEEQLNNLFKDKDICINLVGILFENKKNSFKNIHTNFPSILSKKAEEHKLKQFKNDKVRLKIFALGFIYATIITGILYYLIKLIAS